MSDVPFDPNTEYDPSAPAPVRRFPRVWVLVLLALLFAGVAAAGVVAWGTVRKAPVVQEAQRAVEKTVGGERVIETDTESMYAEFLADPVAADAKYKGKTVRIRAVGLFLETGRNDVLYARYYPSPRPEDPAVAQVICFGFASYDDVLGLVPHRFAYTLTGEYAGYSAGVASVAECVITKREPRGD